MSSKGNPLFVDSTKLTTDTVAAHFELKGEQLAEGEQYYLKVVDKLGAEHSQSMKESGDNVFECQIWLQHQQEVRLQFFVLAAEGISKSSVIFKDRVNYLMDYSWQQSETDELVDLYKKVDKTASTEQSESENGVFGEIEEMSALLDKWGL